MSGTSTKTGTVRDALAELTRVMTRRLDHVQQLADCDFRIERLRAQIAEVLQLDPIPTTRPESVLHGQPISLALLPGPLSAATISRRIRQPEGTVRESLKRLALTGRVKHIGQQRGCNSRWELVGRVAQA